jgi:hypothetical protein
MEIGQNISALWKESCLACKTTIEFNIDKCKSQHVFVFTKIGLTITQSILPSHYNMSCSLFNAFCIWEILHSVDLLCKPTRNMWQMGSELVLKLWFRKTQCKKIFLIFQVAYYLHHDQFSQFHIFRKFANKYLRFCR